MQNLESSFTTRAFLVLGTLLLSVTFAVASDTPPDPSLLPLLQQMVQEDPQAADTWRLIGRIHRSQGDHQQALDAFQQALTIQSDSAAAHHDLGRLLMEMGQADAAQNHFQMVKKYAPQSSYAQQLADDSLITLPDDGVVNAGFEITGETQSEIEQTAYEIQTFDGADDLDL